MSSVENATASSPFTPKSSESKRVRQLSVKDMFSSSPSAKKTRLDGVDNPPSSPVPSSSQLSSTSTFKKSAFSSSSSSSSLFILSKFKNNISSLPSFNSIPFSLSTFKASLTEQELDLLKLELDTLGKSWLKVLASEIRKGYFIELKKFLKSEGVGLDNGKIFPFANDIYSWSRHTPLTKVKVVIIGQDPYHNVGQAHGLCFSVRPKVKPPASLKNIYTELKNEYPDFVAPSHGYLSSWAESGVLLLNTSLTVRAHTAGSHAGKGWETFTDAVVDAVDLYGGAGFKDTSGKSNGVVFLAWGAWAAKRVAKLDKKKHLILTSAHPSPFSAHKGFLGNGHFKKANDWLSEKYGDDATVNWTKLDLPTSDELPN